MRRIVVPEVIIATVLGLGLLFLVFSSTVGMRSDPTPATTAPAQAVAPATPGQPTPTRQPAPTSPATVVSGAPSTGGGDAERGKAVFAAQSCVACHTISSVPGAVGQVGPKLDGVGTRAATRRPGFTAEQYIERHIREPGEFTVPGYPAGVMPKLPLTDAQVKDLVAFLLTLK